MPLTTGFKLHECPYAPSSTAARLSPPSSKDYPFPRLRQTSPLHCTSTCSFRYPARLYRPCSLPGMRRRMLPHARNRVNPQAHPHTLAKCRRHAHAHTLAHRHTRTLALGRQAHSRMRRWVRCHRGDEGKGDQGDDHRQAANKRKEKAKLPLIKPPRDAFE